MTPLTLEDWQAANQSHLSAALTGLKSRLRQYAGQASEETPADTPPADEDESSWSDGEFGAGPPPALETLCAAFGLSRFERDILLWCAGIEMDAAFAPLCADAHGDRPRNFPTFGLALAALPEAHWSALTPAAPLRRWRLLEVGPGPGLTAAPLRIDERILHYLAGVPHTDERLAGLVEGLPRAAPEDLAPSQTEVVARVAAAWAGTVGSGGPALVQLCGSIPGDARAVAACAAERVGCRAMVLAADLIPAAPAELDALLRLWEREATLGRAILLVEHDGPEPPAAGDEARGRPSGAARFLERVAGPVIAAGREPFALTLRPCVHLDLNPPTAREQQTVWREAMAPVGGDAGGIDAVAAQFSLNLPSIRAVAAEALAQAAAAPGSDPADLAWFACRARCRTHLDGLAQRIEPAATWQDLVLPAHQIHALRQIVQHVRHRGTVHEQWGFAARSSRGLGIAALFAGASGTGKTMAAEVLAAELRLDLYRIDLASMVSKYIGETEKNLRRVFDAAEASGAILLFDEADALFGKRSEVKDSHDRYANIEVSYLLQRIEASRGLAILTTNLKNVLDPAFLRRLRFVVQFPFPDVAERMEIWRRVFPPGLPTEPLDLPRLASLNIAGGNIRNIALHAAFHAAGEGRPLGMDHLREAAKSEYGKLERPAAEAEIGGFP